MKKLSVIVPVYRVEEYLPRCLDSILSQQIPDMEVLVVDDGSPDGCFQIMERYARQYPEEIRIFQKENGGLKYNISKPPFCAARPIATVLL